ncbi:MAG: IspD/TarI family cytidylyltransferase [Lachnospiraceae bacterium]|nr:IspD/TarI family cytidylyltransferase [Lachnospiraceae bacterium]
MNIGIIFAGGSGLRMKTNGKPKQFLELYGKPIIIHTLEVFEGHPDIDGIVISCLSDWIPYLKKLLRKFEITKAVEVVPGGSTGQESIYNALKAASERFPEDSVVLIHDGVRPLIDRELISRNIQSTLRFGNAISAVSCNETIVESRDGVGVERVPERKALYTAQAPQSFFLKDILAVHEIERAAGQNTAIDSCMLMKKHGYEMHMVEGLRSNIKITTPNDFYVFRALYDLRESEQIFG